MTVWMIAGLLTAQAETAETTEAPRTAGHLDIVGGTQFPVTAGGGLRYEAASRLQLSAAVGVIPQAYADTLQTAIAVSGVGEEVGIVADAMLSGAPYAHVGIGLRPFPRRGLTLAVGHQTLWMSGTAEEVAIQGYTIDADAALSSRLRMVTAEVRSDRVIGGRFLLSWSLGGMKTYAADSELSLPDGLEVAGLDVLTEELDGFYEETFRTPTLGLSVGYRFF